MSVLGKAKQLCKKARDGFNSAWSRLSRPVRIGLLTLAAGSLAYGGFYTKEKVAPTPDRSASLTAGEIALTHSIFGADFETASIRKHFYNSSVKEDVTTLGDGHTAAYVWNWSKNAMHFPLKKYHSADYSRDSGGLRTMGVFMHEMTHIWQNRTNSSFNCDTYDFDLDPAKNFDDYCNEQQGRIVQRYVELTRDPASGRNIMGDYIVYSGAQQQLLRLVENKFPAAKATRLSEERRLFAFNDCMRKIKPATDPTAEKCISAHMRNLIGEPILSSDITVSPRQPAAAKPAA